MKKDLALHKYKKSLDYSYTFGVFPTLELLMRQPTHVMKVIVSTKGETNIGISKIWELCHKHTIQVEINDGLLNKISPKENIYALGVFKKYTSKLNDHSNHIVLVHPSDTGNLGTIIRTMLGFQMRNLALVRPAVDFFDPKVIRASMGAVFSIHFSYFDSFIDYQKDHQQHFYPFMTNGEIQLPDAAFKTPFSLIFGNEAAGLGDNYLEIGTSVAIPQNHLVDSLNLAVAVGIALYESRSK
ncbi:MAG TPA: TrmH family RNA methyltransferase [Ktedonosporobacter sp.]|jgi:TrmH family RNA methyltransferase|nr:TrmH family RNA methyltransferase [Ktedonosporobacter sp.]